jgi:hypothetical protein
MRRSEHVKKVVKTLLSNPSFQSDVAWIRQSLGIPAEGFDGEDASEDWKNAHYIADPSLYGKVQNELKHLVSKYPNLSSAWISGLDRYVFVNSPDRLLLINELEVSVGQDPITGKRVIEVRMPMDASREHIEEALVTVTQLKKYFRTGGATKLQPAPYLEYEIEAHKLYEQQGSYKGASRVMTANHGDNFSAERVRDLIRNFKIRSGIN